MNDNNDDAQKYGLTVLTLVVGAVVVGVIAYALSHRPGRTNATTYAANHATATHKNAGTLTILPVLSAQGVSATAAETPALVAIPATVSASAVTLAAPDVQSAAVAVEPDGRVYFEVGSDALPPQASDVLVKVAESARMQAGKSVLISGYHDATGDPVKNADLAKRRALAVRHALEANGVAPNLLVMAKPVMAVGGVDAREARRVELWVR
jgi:outer membrane protein OmpA-like peptidoglycan-associated protein